MLLVVDIPFRIDMEVRLARVLLLREGQREESTYYDINNDTQLVFEWA